MKIFLYNPDTGFYLGEDFADDLPMCPVRDALPPDATTIAPPPHGSGKVPVFLPAEQRWEIRPLPGAEKRDSESCGVPTLDAVLDHNDNDGRSQQAPGADASIILGTYPNHGKEKTVPSLRSPENQS